MAGDGRIEKSAKNMASGVAFRLLSVATAFAVRTVFIQCLNNDYLSVNGLYSGILSMLSLAELGFGTAMVYSMYKPLAEKDYVKLAQIMRLYRRVYILIGAVILVLGLCLIPFLDFLIKEKPAIPNLTLYYILFLGNTVLSYWFFAYRNSILQADQKAYVISNYSSIFTLIKSGLQIILLYVSHSFTIYLLTQMVCTVLQNIALSIKVKKEYPVFSGAGVGRLPKEEKDRIFKDVKALMLQKISFRVLNTSDSLIISTFIGLGWVGILSNYIMIEEAVVAVLTQFTGAITASLGNYFAKESKASGYNLFKRVMLVHFWLYGFSAVAFLVLLNPFVKLWLGRFGGGYVLDEIIVVALVCRFFVEGYMNMMSTFRSTLGLFTQGQYFPLVTAMLNIILSIGLSFPFGVAGVVFATPLARCCINVWYMPLIIHRDGFQESVVPFYISCVARLIMIIGVAAIMLGMSQLIFINGVTLWNFTLMTALTAIVPNVIFLLAFYRTDEFKYFGNLLIRFVKRLSHR